MELGEKAQRDFLILLSHTSHSNSLCVFVVLTTFFVFYFELNPEIIGVNCFKLNLVINDEYPSQNQIYHIARKVVYCRIRTPYWSWSKFPFYFVEKTVCDLHEVIIKIFDHFPKYSLDWILFGNKKPEYIEIEKLSAEIVSIIKRWREQTDKNI
ncbi:MAG: hypothetical protein ACPH53_04495 [Flavobacteriaceae bacterium]